MANTAIKITDLNALPSPVDADVFVVVDVANDETKKIDFSNLRAAVGAAGISNTVANLQIAVSNIQSNVSALQGGLAGTNAALISTQAELASKDTVANVYSTYLTLYSNSVSLASAIATKDTVANVYATYSLLSNAIYGKSYISNSNSILQITQYGNVSFPTGNIVAGTGHISLEGEVVYLKDVPGNTYVKVEQDHVRIESNSTVWHFNGGDGILYFPTNNLIIDTGNPDYNYIDSYNSDFIRTIGANVSKSIGWYSTGSLSETLAAINFNASNTGAVDISANTAAWSFKTDGTVSFPNGGIQGNAFTQSYVVNVASALSNANSAISALQGGLTGANSAISALQGGLTGANSAISALQGGLTGANSAISALQGGLTGANTAIYNITNLPVTFESDVTIRGNLSLVGNSTLVVGNTIGIGDTLISLASNNTVNDVVDIGIYGHYYNGSANSHAGLVRSGESKDWMLFGRYDIDLQSNSFINIADPSFGYANLRLDVANALSVYSNGVELRANDYTTYTTLTTNYSANDGVTLSSAYSNDAATLLLARSNDYTTYTTLAANDSATLLSAYSNDATTLGFARSNDYATYSILSANINSVQSNLDSFAIYANSNFAAASSGAASLVQANLTQFAYNVSANVNSVQSNLDSFAAYANASLGGGGGGNSSISYVFSNYTTTTSNSYYIGSIVSDVNRVSVHIDGVYQSKSSYVLANSSSNIQFKDSSLASGKELNIETVKLIAVVGGIGEDRYTSDMSNISANISSASGSISGIVSNNSNTITLSAGYNILPATDSLQNLGSPTAKFKTLYLSGNTLNLGDTAISSDANGAVSFTASGNLVGISAYTITIGPANNAVTISASAGGGISYTSDGVTTQVGDVNAVQVNLSLYASYAASNLALYASNAASNVNLVQTNLTLYASNADSNLALYAINVASNINSVQANVDSLSSLIANLNTNTNSNVSTVQNNLTLYASNAASNVNSVQTNLTLYASNAASNLTLYASNAASNLTLYASNAASNVNLIQTNLTLYASNAASNVNLLQSNLTSLTSVVNNITALPVTFQSDISVEGNLYLRGNTINVISNTVNFGDSLLSLASNNIVNDIIDIGIYGHYYNGSANSHTGLFRSYISKDWMLFSNYTIDLEGNSTINIADPSFGYANLRLDVANALSVYSNGVELRANDYSTYTTITTAYSANDGVTLTSARSNDYSTYTVLAANDSATLLSAYANDYTTYNSLLSAFNVNVVVTLASAYANDGVTLASAYANDYTTYTTITTAYSANDGVTLASALSNDYSTYTTLAANDSATLLSAYANDYTTYNTLNTRINNVQSNISSSGAITVYEEGSSLTTALTSLNFVGSGVVASNVQGNVTVTISGGGGGGVDQGASYVWTNVHTFSNTISVNAISANGSLGDFGQILTSTGSDTYWANAAATVTLSNAITQTFTGNGTTTNFTLPTSVSNQNNIIVSINGLVQLPTTHYTITGTTLSFTSAPYDSAVIEARDLGGVIASVGGGSSSISSSDLFLGSMLLGGM